MGVARAAERKRMMERLTKTSEKGGLAFTFDLDVTCNPSDMRKIYDIGVKLKAYEDTGLTPEDLKSAFGADTIIKLCAQALGVSADRLRELAAADHDGRVVVLPCKVGDKVWMHEKTFIRGEIVNSVELETISEMRGNALNPVWFFAGDRDFSPSEIGKTVFLTRAEAEAALKEQEAQK